MKLACCKEAATAADCKRMLSKENAASVQAADAQMSTWRRLIEALPDGAKKLSSSNVQTALSLGDMSLAAYTLSLNIPGEDLKRYQCKEALAHDIVLILQGVLSCSIPSPWLAHATEPAKDTETDSQKGVKLTRELNEDGSVKDSACLLNEAGFFNGSWVRRKADMESGNITAVQNGKVSLKQNERMVKVPLDAFLDGQWALFTPKAEPQVLEDVRAYSPNQFPGYTRQILIANCALDLNELYEKHQSSQSWDRLRVTLKPRKSVVATNFLGKGKLILCPARCKSKLALRSRTMRCSFSSPSRSFKCGPSRPASFRRPKAMQAS